MREGAWVCECVYVCECMYGCMYACMSPTCIDWTYTYNTARERERICESEHLYLLQPMKMSRTLYRGTWLNRVKSTQREMGFHKKKS